MANASKIVSDCQQALGKGDFAAARKLVSNSRRCASGRAEVSESPVATRCSTALRSSMVDLATRPTRGYNGFRRKN